MQRRSSPPHLWTATTIPHQPLFIVPRRLQHSFSAGRTPLAAYTPSQNGVCKRALSHGSRGIIAASLASSTTLSNQRRFLRTLAAPSLGDCRRLSRAQYRYRRSFASLALSIARSSRQPTQLFSCIRSFRRCRSPCAFARAFARFRRSSRAFYWGALFASVIAAALHSHSRCVFKSSDTATAADTAPFSSPLISQALLFAAITRVLSPSITRALLSAHCRCATFLATRRFSAITATFFRLRSITAFVG